MQRRESIKALLMGSVFLSGCVSDPEGATTTPDETETETETPVYPEVGKIYVQKFEPEDHTEDPGWDLVLELNEDYTEGTLRMIEVDDRANYDDNIIDRINLQREDSVLRFPYIRNDQLQLPRDGYIFRLEIADDLVAESHFNINRDISAGSPQFESHIGGEEYEYEPQVLEFGKTSFSVRIENIGNVPLIIDNVAAKDMGHPGVFGFWLNGEIQHFGHTYLYDILHPGESKRYGAVGYTLPRLENVEQTCDGSERSTVINIERYGINSWKYRLTYTLDEPASGTGLQALHRDQEKFVCESGEILDFTKIS